MADADQLPIIRLIERDAAVIQRAVICLLCADPIIEGDPPPSQYGLIIEYDPASRPLLLTEQDAIVILNDGVLNRKGIKIEFANT
jgi:hypothetical protein